MDKDGFMDSLNDRDKHDMSYFFMIKCFYA